MPNPYTVLTSKNPIKFWCEGVPVDPKAEKQIVETASLPFIHSHVAVMPDTHFGIGATVGTVIATKGAIVPAAVGVDIGCGMMALKTSIDASTLPDNLNSVRTAIEAAVPHGRTKNGGAGDIGSWTDPPAHVKASWLGHLNTVYKNLTDKHPKILARRPVEQLGTLGTGNHFVEICLDQDNAVWIMLHSGSRGAGNAIGQYFISKAKEEMERYHINEFLPNKDLAYLVENTVIFDDYIAAVNWAQSYAETNRVLMAAATASALKKSLGMEFSIVEEAINCHHNYVAKENHFNANVLVTRKGAIRAREGDLGIIPGSMGTGSFIVRGKGNAQSFNSCSHGAGRVMSRRQARDTITLEEHAKAMQGIEARTDAGILDESPAAYKDINAVMNAQTALIDIVYRLKQIVNVKG